jgi:hypothetical protein
MLQFRNAAWIHLACVGVPEMNLVEKVAAILGNVFDHANMWMSLGADMLAARKSTT